jgi:hypothetical protein
MMMIGEMMTGNYSLLHKFFQTPMEIVL